MHGFYSLQPWDHKEQRLLIHRLPVIDRLPDADEPAVIGMVDGSSRQFKPLAETHAWNFQLGSMAQWIQLPDGEEGILYNDRRDGRFVCILLRPDGTERMYECPVYTVSHDGRFAFGYNFARVQAWRPGYAYSGVPYPLAERPTPADEGIIRIDLCTGASQLILSYAQLKQAFPHPDAHDTPVFISRLLCNPHKDLLVLSYRFRSANDGKYRTCLIATDFDGKNPVEVAGFGDAPAHFDWCGSSHMVVWLHPGPPEPKGFYLIETDNGQRQPLAHGILTRDGHCSFGADTRRMLIDTFPDQDSMQHLYIYDRQTNSRQLLGSFLMPAEFGFRNQHGDLRCDLHPCWSPSGKAICFDSLHEGRRAVYTFEIR